MLTADEQAQSQVLLERLREATEGESLLVTSAVLTQLLGSLICMIAPDLDDARHGGCAAVHQDLQRFVEMNYDDASFIQYRARIQSERLSH
jgi:hypothetical protein